MALFFPMLMRIGIIYNLDENEKHPLNADAIRIWRRGEIGLICSAPVQTKGRMLVPCLAKGQHGKPLIAASARTR